jgi:TonB family protein
MPITEVPTEVPNSPPPTQSPETELSQPRNTSSYGDLGTDELVQRINELEDERRAARIREGIWVALLLHAAVLLLWAFGPRYIFHQTRVVSPADALKDRKDLTYLDMPPDALQKLKPKNPTVMSDKDRVQSSPHPTLDKKTLAQLQAMKPAGPPAPAPQEQSQLQQPSAPAPQQQQQAPSQPQQQPQQQAQQAPSAPSPLQTLPRQQPTPSQSPSNPFKTSNSAGDIIRQATRGAVGGPASGDFGQNAPQVHGGMNAGVQILSDTSGWDYAPYMQRVVQATYRAWLPIIPISARPPLDDKGKVYISFHIMPDGSVRSMSLDGPSGETALDRAAWAGITNAGYPPLPPEYKGKDLWLRFGFYYNIDPSMEK